MSKVKGGKGFKLGVFRPIYRLDSSQLNQLDKVLGDTLNKKGQNKSRKGGRKRPYISTIIEGSQENYLVYKLRHKLLNYFYIFPKKAFKGFKP